MQAREARAARKRGDKVVVEHGIVGVIVGEHKSYDGFPKFTVRGADGREESAFAREISIHGGP